MRPADPRQLAFEVLERVEDGAFCDALVGATLARGELAPRDAALFTRLVYGTIAWRARLDWTIAGLARRPIERIDAPVRTALRLGLFQITRLDRIPAHAAVHTSVELAKRAYGPAAARFVNAILRACLRQGGERPLPAPGNAPARALALAWSHPEWLVERWLAELGLERTTALLAADNEPAPTVLRIDRRLGSRDEALAELRTRGIGARATAFADFGVIVDEGAPLALDLPWAMPQGEASQLVAALVGARSGERIADLCAAPGGKSAALAESVAVGSKGFVVAADRSRSGMKRVRVLANRAAGDAIAGVRADATAPPFPSDSFDAVLLDAPCSGLGTLRAHPEIRWRRTPAELGELAATQRRMLAAAARLVRPGGRLVYATCTIAREENEDVIDGFLTAHPEFARVDPRPYLPASAAALIGDDDAFRSAPDRGGLDGFYALRMKRTRA